MLTYPNISPVAFSIGPLQVHWYGLMYLVGFILAYALGVVRRERMGWTAETVSDLIFYGAMGVILGGRIGYMLFYNTSVFLHAPWTVFKIWEGGMSFHGGLIGVAIALILFARRVKKPFWEVADFVAPLVPIGLAAGRIGNFINGELWGRVTDAPWGMVFPYADNMPRHPSQLYEFFLEGVLLFIIVWVYSSKPRPAGRVSALFLMGYAVMRIIAECFRQPDLPIGFVLFQSVTMGQLLSIPMFLIGIFLWWKSK